MHYIMKAGDRKVVDAGEEFRYEGHQVFNDLIFFCNERVSFVIDKPPDDSLIALHLCSPVDAATGAQHEAHTQTRT